MKTKVFSLLLLARFAIPCAAQEISIAAASDLHNALGEIAAHFQSEKKVQVKISYGSSGNFFQQIQSGAPFDLFFSANTDYPSRLEASGLVAPDSYLEYARGKIVLMVSSTSRLDLAHGMSVLLDPAVKKIAIADPSHAPYGQAAVAALKSKNLYDKVSGKIVMGENISQAASFVISGAADIGIVAMSLAISPSAANQVKYSEIPNNSYPPIQQACVILRSSKQQKLAREFENFIQQSDSKNIFRKYGFEVPEHGGKPLH